jgi:endonuclease/exonuclease/phosphatase family metal-dependent hydrolase
MSWVSKVVWFFNYFTIASMLVAYAAYFISPASISFLAFFGLAFQFIAVANIFFLIYWILRWRKKFWINLFVLLPSIIFIQKIIPVHLFYEKPPAQAFKVMSYNVRLFDLYNWSKNKETRNKMFDFLKAEANDILCMQEVFVDDSGEFETLDTLVKLQHAKNAHIEYTTTLRGKHHWGIATLTSFKIVNKGKIEFDGTTANNTCIFTDVLINADTVRIYNMHLQSVLFSKQDYKFIDDIENNREVEEIEGSKNILKRLNKAFVLRSSQAEKVAAHIQKSPYTVIVTGDFNDTPFSYTYQKIGKGLCDAFAQSGSGLGKTYIGLFPSFRIDYILHTKAFSSYYYQTSDIKYSDHYPVSCFLSKK